MSKNLIPEIAKMLGVELGEEFKIKGYGEAIYMLTDNGLMAADSPATEWAPANALFISWLRGREQIVKMPWKPKMYEEYWTFGKLGKQWIVGTLIWKELPYEILLLGKGWIFRTKEEAEAALPKVAKKLGVKYEL